MIRSSIICSRMIRSKLNLISTLRGANISFVAIFVLLLSSIAFGQGGVATGDLRITVRDPKGGLVANATVTVNDLAKGLARTATGDGQGGYTARQLPPGSYSVTVEASGFAKTEATNVSITVGGLVDLPLNLAVASGKEVVEVSSQADLVETSRTSTTDTIGQRRIDNLPINGRDFDRLPGRPRQRTVFRGRPYFGAEYQRPARPLEFGECGWRGRYR
ncbi:MAG: carboxypeptidase-like regulatory domain-containing protein [Candidatus Sulfotelmatobacter sp.]